jgi:hypothetical protein
MSNGMSLSGYVWYVIMITVMIYAIRACGVADANDRAIGTDTKPTVRTEWPWE